MKVTCKCYKCGKTWKVKRDKMREVKQIVRDRKNNMIVCDDHENFKDFIYGNAVYYK